MNKNLLHIVSTRLFTTLQPDHDEEWLKERLLVFCTFTLPSFINQTSQDFHWILLISERLPTAIVELLNDIIAPYSNFYTLQVNVKDLHDQPEYDSAFKQFIDNKKLKYDFLLHSRIDGDDAWNINYVKQVQENAQTWISNHQKWQNVSGIIFNFPRGEVCYPIMIRNKHGIGKWKRKFFSQSVDVLTKKGNLDTFYKFPHSKTRKFAKQHNFRCIYLQSEEPMWLYVQHTQNDGLLRNWHRWFLLFEKTWMQFRTFNKNSLLRYGIDDHLLATFKSEYKKS